MEGRVRKRKDRHTDKYQTDRQTDGDKERYRQTDRHRQSQAPGVIGSALGLVGPVSVYCDWVR